MSVALGQSVELQCNAEGTPPPSVSWYHMEGEEIEPILVSDSDLLYIPSAKLLDSGKKLQPRNRKISLSIIFNHFLILCHLYYIVVQSFSNFMPYIVYIKF